MSDIKILNDATFDIATGRSRTETSWKNKETTWSALIDKLKNTHYTSETHAEYMSAKKGRQDEIKDIGGFVGGYITGGRRKAGNISHRRLLTLDVDFGSLEMWQTLIILWGVAACIYTTHKHSPESPRFRLVILCDRDMRPDEYEAVARKVAGSLGIENFDHTTFEPSRLMYWPSTSKGSEYVFEYNDGPALSVDDVLASYHDWQDSSSWPVSESVNKLVQRSIVKQGDPTEKAGVVGAFCRTYGIAQAIETFLPEVYTECAVENRYTYVEGSTAAGLVVYDDKYAYSHHGTDPASNKLCNAFDLVRVHKFGLRDEDAAPNTPDNRKPSYTAMIEFSCKDEDVRTLNIKEKLATAAEDFEGVDLDAEDDDPDWAKSLESDAKNNVLGTINNVLLILQNDPYFKGKIAYDDFEKCEVAIKDLPWRKIDDLSRRLIDKDDSNIRHYIEKIYKLHNMTKTLDAMSVLSSKTSFHPVRDYLSGVTWDGESRVDTLLVDYQGAEDSAYMRMITRKILVAAVARVFEPGVKFDHVLVLVGEQGLKKSSLIAKLGRQWFSDSFSTIEGKESFEQLQGVWLVEIAELAGLAKAEVEKIKHFITKRDDRYRVAFGRRTEKFPRQCVFFATTNKKDFLRDPTGDRRYWPARVNVVAPTKDVFKDLTDDEIDQVWAEAVSMYKQGETLYLPESMVAIATKIQKDHTEEHPWYGMIQKYLDTELPTNWAQMSVYERRAFLAGGDELTPAGEVFRSKVCIYEIWREAINGKETIDERSANAIRNIMLNMEGWGEQTRPTKHGIYGTQRKGFYRLNVPAEVLENSIKNTVTTRLQ